MNLRNRIYVKGYGFLFLAKNMRNIVKGIGKNISKNLIGNYNQKVFNHAQKSPTDALKTAAIREIQKTAKAIGDFIENKIHRE